MQDMLELILTQQREMNAAFGKFGERLASVETKVTILVGGDGQPGSLSSSIGILQDDVKDLQRWLWRVVGIATGVATVMSGIVTGVALLLKG